MLETTVELARRQMIEQQIRAWTVLDTRVLAVFENTPREQFVPEPYHGLAFADTQIPLGHDQVMMAPKVEGRLLQALNVQTGDNVLEVGTGSGFLAAALAAMGGQVLTVDIHEDFVRSASANLQAAGVTGVAVEARDSANLDWCDRHFDAIAVTGSMPVLHDSFAEHLNVNGRLFAIVGESPVMEALVITRTAKDAWTRESLFETDIPALLNVFQPPKFRF